MSLRDPIPGGGTRVDRQDGAVMVIALAFLTVVGLLAVVVLSMAWTGSNTLAVYRQDRVLRYNAEAALQTTVLRLATNPLMGTVDRPDLTTDTRDCPMDFALQQDPGGTAPIPPTFTSGSFLKVTCAPTSAANATGPWGGSGASGYYDTVSQTQSPRDVTITITCTSPPSTKAKDPVTCGSAGTSQVIAKARVRFEIDYSLTDKQRWAVVPKVVTWDVRR